MIKVEYGVIATGAKEKFTPELLNCASISKVADLSKSDLEFKNFGNPCEKYSILLDGRNLPIPQNIENENMGVWSQFISNENGEFDDSFPTIILSSDELFGVEGLGLQFDVFNNVYPTVFSVSWYNGENLIATKEYQSSSSIFSTTQDVENYNKIILVFKKMNTPYSRLKLHSIQYGSILIIEEKSIQNIRIHQVVSPISTTIPASTLSLSFLNTSNANYNFAERQSLKIINNDALVGRFFIENSKQINKKQWNIKAQDYIGILESAEFEGGIFVDELALNILTAIFGKANVPFTVSPQLSEKTLTGYIPYSTCRKALQQVLFAIGGYANTSYSENVDILALDTEITQSISLDKILVGQTVSIDADVTEIELFGHNYTQSNNEMVLYNSKESVENTKIIFSEPIYDLKIENGEIIKSGTNYAVISCGANGVLKGKKFEHSTFSKIRYNTNAQNAKTTNKKTIKTATLISSSNIDDILDMCYNYIVKNIEVKSKAIEQDSHFIVGKTYEIETELLGKVTGFLTEQSFSLHGGKKIAKEMVIR